jgi:flagellin
MTALRHVSNVEDRISGSVQKLATGLRINSAGDDPAGLIISEGLRTQIKGLDQAVRNSQDAINLAKTAEGALDEVQSLLLNLRALAVHSANTAVVDAQQLQANQTQFRATIESINRIAEHTSWGTKKLLNGSAGTVANVTQTNYVKSLYVGSTLGGETVGTGAVNITRVTQGTKTNVQLATAFTGGTDNPNTGSFAINGVAFEVEAGETVDAVIAKINTKANLTNVTASLDATNNVVLTATGYGDNFPINYVETGGAPGILNNGSSQTATLGNNAVFDVEVPMDGGGTTTERFTGGQGPGVDGLEMISPDGNRMVMTEDGNQQSGTIEVGGLNVGELRFQIGANSGQMVSFSIPKLFADGLGDGIITGQNLSTVDVTRSGGAEEAIRIVDGAVKELAVLRGELGSFQKNFLESTVRSLGVAVENITSSESQIRDADVAKEMTEFTKIQVLRQSGMSVLAQAAQAPNAVLQLLQQ